MNTRYVTTSLGRTSFVPADGYVHVYTKTSGLGAWKVDRYANGVFGIKWIREWAKENLIDPAVSS